MSDSHIPGLTAQEVGLIESALDLYRERCEYEDSQLPNAEPGRWESELDTLSEKLYDREGEEARELVESERREGAPS